jgi:Circularly permutated YpsA SLOG family
VLRKILSAGQTGADCAGLDFAIEVGLEHGGFVPRGRRAEEGRMPGQYHLTELRVFYYAARTKRNVREANETVVFSLDSILTGGSL